MNKATVTFLLAQVCNVDMPSELITSAKWGKTSNTVINRLQNTQKYSIKTGQLYLRFLCRSLHTHAVMLLSSTKKNTHSSLSADVKCCMFKRLSFICCTLLSPHLKNVATLYHFWGVHKLVAWQPHVRATWLSIKTTSLHFLNPSTVTNIFTSHTQITNVYQTRARLKATAIKFVMKRGLMTITARQTA